MGPISDPEASAAERRQALARYDILDTPPETEFDDVVKLTSEICEAPVSLVSLLDADRQWFKAEIGFGRRETPLTASICAHAVRQRDLLVIRDTTIDPRTADNPLVTGDPHVRFYAGVPLETPEGVNLGTLCVLDTKPRDLTPAQSFALRTLARQVMSLLALRLALRDRHASDLRNKAILESAIDYAIISMDLEGRVTSWNSGAAHILGWTEDEMRGHHAHVFFTPQDVEAGVPEREMGSAILSGRGNDERWHRRKDGSLFWAFGEMMPLKSADGTVQGFIKILRDRTEQRARAEADKDGERRLHLALQAGRLGAWELDLDTGELAASDMCKANYGVLPDQRFAYADLIDSAHPDERERVRHAFETTIATGVICDIEYPIVRPDGSDGWVLIQAQRHAAAQSIAGRVSGFAIDVTARKSVERQFARSEERLSLALAASGMVGIWDWDLKADVIYADENFARIYAVDPEWAARGAPLAEYTKAFHPDDLPAFQAELDRVFAGAEEFLCEYRIVQPDQSFRWVLARGRLITDRFGVATRFPGATVDITERKLAEVRQAALMELGDRIRDLNDSGQIIAIASEIIGRALRVERAGYAATDPGAETIVIEGDWCAPGFRSLAGTHHFRDYGSFIDTLSAGDIVAIADIGRDERTTAGAPRLIALGVKALLNLPFMEHGRFVGLVFALSALPHDWSPEDIALLRNMGDRVRAAIARVESEDRQRVLNLELSHRMKNMLSMVQAIATQTMRGAADIETAKAVLSGRLIALGQAHDILLGKSLGTASMRAVVEGAVQLHQDGPERVVVEGPEVTIGAKAALSLSLILHELATNAAKYGALSIETGQVSIGWSVEPDEADPDVCLTWRERGGPPVREPNQKGFGSRLIERGLAGSFNGDVLVTYAPAGVTCVITAPLSGFQSDDAPKPQTKR